MAVVPYGDGMSAAWLRQRPARVPAWVVDAGWAVAVAVAVTITIRTAREPGARPPDPLAYALGITIGALLLARRRWPLVVLLASFAALQLYYVLDYPGIPAAVPLVVALSTAGAAGIWWCCSRPPRRPPRPGSWSRHLSEATGRSRLRHPASAGPQTISRACWGRPTMASEAPTAGCVPASDQGHAPGGQGDLQQQLDPVDTAGAANVEGVGDERPDDGGDDAHHDRKPDGMAVGLGALAAQRRR
jgi:hypothetical protein